MCYTVRMKNVRYTFSLLMLVAVFCNPLGVFAGDSYANEITLDDPIFWEDAIVEQKTREILGKPSGTIKVRELSAVTELDLTDTSLQNGGVTTLYDLQNFSHIQKLSIWGHKIDDLSYILHLPLRELHFDNHFVLWKTKSVGSYAHNLNQIQDINTLEKLTVRGINTGSKTLSLEPLSYLQNLKELDIIGLPINTSSVHVLTELPQFTTLYTDSYLALDRLASQDFEGVSIHSENPAWQSRAVAHESIFDPLTKIEPGFSVERTYSRVSTVVEPKRIFSGVSAKDDGEIRWRDEHIEELVRSAFTSAAEEPISYAVPLKKSDVMRVTSLHLDSPYIDDLDDLKHFENLEVLEINNTQIDNLDALKDLQKLETLVLLNNKELRSIKPLSNLENLRTLDMRNNDISSIDSLRKLKKLHTLRLDYNPIESLEAIEDLKNLKTLTAMACNIVSTAPLASLRNIEELSLSGNYIASLDALEDLKKLQKLNVSHNAVYDIAALKNLTNITALEISYNEIETIESLESLSKLEALFMANNSIKDMSLVSTFKNLTYLRFWNNPISKAQTKDLLNERDYLIDWVDPIVETEMRRHLQIYDRAITTSDVQSVREFTLYPAFSVNEDTQVRSLDDLALCTNLRSLSLYGRLISDLSPLSQLPLVFLEVYNSNPHGDAGGGQISSIEPLATIQDLEILILKDVFVDSYYALADLSNLRVLTLDPFSNLQDYPLEALPNLRTLILYKSFTDDSPDLSSLSTLNLSKLSYTGPRTNMDFAAGINQVETEFPPDSIDQDELARLREREDEFNVERERDNAYEHDEESFWNYLPPSSLTWLALVISVFVLGIIAGAKKWSYGFTCLISALFSFCGLALMIWFEYTNYPDYVLLCVLAVLPTFLVFIPYLFARLIRTIVVSMRKRGKNKKEDKIEEEGKEN